MPSLGKRRDANGAAWRKARARVLYAEDICAICGQPVDKTLDWLDPMSAQVDHIVPSSRGGHRTARTNLQLAHRVCNIRKGDGSRAPDPVRTSKAW